MIRTTQMILGAVSAAAILGLGAAPASAGHFKELSRHHNNYGVSQFNALALDTESDMVLYNPNHVTQVAAVLLYEESTVNYSFVNEELTFDNEEDFPLEIYVGCLVVKLTPHAALELDWPFMTAFGDLYAEVIFVPEDPVRVAIAALGGQRKSRRVADGLGGVAMGQDEEESRGFHLVHPSAFTLPDETVDYVFDASKNQQEAARQCICAGIFDLVDEPFNNLTTPLRVFEPFGITCP